MKKFDYCCIVYSIALLIFGFNDDVPKQTHAAQTIEPGTKVEQQVVVSNPERTRRHSQYASIVPVTQKPVVPMRALVSTK